MNPFDKSVDTRGGAANFRALDHTFAAAAKTQLSMTLGHLKLPPTRLRAMRVNLPQKAIHGDPLNNQFFFRNYKVDSTARAQELPWLGIASSGAVRRPTGKR